MSRTVTQTVTNPEQQGYRQHGRQEVRADRRVLRAHDRAVNQYTQYEAARGQARQAHRHGAILITLMQAIHRQNQCDNREDGKWHHGAEQRCECAINREAGEECQQ